MNAADIPNPFAYFYQQLEALTQEMKRLREGKEKNIYPIVKKVARPLP